MSASPNYRHGGREGRPARKDDWRTPPELYARLNAEFNFALDAACETHNQLAPIGIRADKGEDGLLISWHAIACGKTVFCNPPYSNVRPWLEQAIRCRNAGSPAVLLVTADTSTRWCLEAVAHEATEVRFLTGRVKFLLPDGTRHDTQRCGGGLTTPSAIVVYRPAGGPPTYTYIPAVIR